VCKSHNAIKQSRKVGKKLVAYSCRVHLLEEANFCRYENDLQCWRTKSFLCSPLTMQLVFSRRSLSALLGSLFTTGFFVGRPERSLVREAKNGDRRAFERLMEIHTPKLRPFASRRLPAAEVDDVLQETWLAAWAGLRLFEGEERFRGWLYSICFRKVQDYWRREHARPQTDWPLSADDEPSYIPKEFSRVEARQSLIRFWDSCTSDQKELLNLYYADGLTLKEISEVLGRNLNTVKYQFYRTHEQAANELPELGPLAAREVHA
jgi:RNA polymerase sigma-70 factor (ECF subfamily)